MLSAARARMLLPVMTLLASSACGPRRPPFIAMPWGEFRMDSVELPLSAVSRARLEDFFAKGGNRRAANLVMNSNLQVQRQILNALEDPANLKVDLSRPVKHFCDDAAPLCRAAPVYRGKVLVRQVVDARNESPGRAAKPLGVTDGEYWYLFESDGEKLSRLTVVRNVERVMER
jgi:hypothetical protein